MNINKENKYYCKSDKRSGGCPMLSLSSGFNYYLCGEPVTLSYRHAGSCNYISSLHRNLTNGDIYIFFLKTALGTYLLFPPLG